MTLLSRHLSAILAQVPDFSKLQGRVTDKSLHKSPIPVRIVIKRERNLMKTPTTHKDNQRQTV